MIGFVDDRDLDRVQADDALTHQVFEPAGARDDDVDAGPQRLLLAVLRDATEDRGDLEVERAGQRFEHRGDLGRQLAGGRQHQAGRTAAALHAVEPGDHRDGEGQRLAAASLAAAQHISPCEGIGKRLLLDRERSDDVTRGERLDQSFVHAEISER